VSKAEDEKEVEELTDRLVAMMDRIRKAQKELNDIEEKAAVLLRSLLRRK